MGCGKRVLVIGDSVLKESETLPVSGCYVEVVDSVAAATERLISQTYDRIVADTALMGARHTACVSDDPECLFRQLHRANADLNAVMKITDIAMSTLELEDLLDAVLKCLSELTGANASAILLREDDHLRVWASVRAEEEIHQRYTVPIGKGFAGAIARTGKSLYIRDAQADPLVTSPFIKKRGIRSILGVPMVHKGELIGVLHIDWLDIHRWDEDELRLLDLIADGCAMAVVNAKLNQELRRVAQLPNEDPYPVMRISRDGLILYANNGAKTLEPYCTCRVGEQAPEDMQTAITAALESGQIGVVDLEVDDKTFSFVVTPIVENDYANLYGRDITDRKRAEEVLRRYQLLAENARDIVLLMDAEGRIIEANEAAVAAYGYTHEDLLSLRIFDLREPADGAEVAAQLMRANISGVMFETLHRRKDGSVFPVEVNSQGATIGDKHVLLSIIRDITERKKSEEALHRSEQRLRGIFDNAGVGIVEVDSEDRFIAVNDRALEILGYSRDELLGMSVHELTAPEDRSSSDELNAQLHECRCDRLDYEKRYLKRDGSPLWVHVTVSAIRDSDGIFVRGIATVEDIHERKLAEEAARELAQRLNSHMENSPLAVIEWDPDYRIIRWSDEAKRVFGWSAGEMLGKHIDDVRWVHEEDWPIVARLMEDMNAGIRPRNVNPNRNYRKNGSIIYCEWYNSVLRDSSGRMTSVLSLVLDVTDRELAEQELARAQAEAEQRAAELQSFTSNAVEGMSLVDAHGNLIWINPAGMEILGIPEGEEPEKWLFKFRRLSLDGQAIPMEDTVGFRALRGEVVKDYRYKVVTPSGKEVVISASASPVRDYRGRIVGASYVFRDVSEQVRFERERQHLYDREHRIAEILQQALIPPMESLEMQGCKVAVKYEPALKEAEVGGDFYDVFELGDGRIGVVIGDVAGKGLMAAVHVAAAKHAIRSYAYLFSSPAMVMTLTNEALCKGQMEDQMDTSMLTAFFAIVDAASGTVMYANAGHEPPVVRTADGGTKELDKKTDIALGVVCGYSYSESITKLHAGETVVIVTDGVTEARPNPTALFGKAGVVDFLRQNRETMVGDIPSRLLEAARLHAGGHLQDDAAIVAFSCDIGGDEDAQDD